MDFNFRVQFHPDRYKFRKILLVDGSFARLVLGRAFVVDLGQFGPSLRRKRILGKIARRHAAPVWQNLILEMSLFFEAWNFEIIVMQREVTLAGKSENVDIYNLCILENCWIVNGVCV